MLTNLHVKNLAIIEEIEVDFTQRLNILTGETGAGKSIIIGSINIALGGKVPSDIIRKGADYALIELVFQVEQESLTSKLIELDLPLEDGQIILSRKIMRGRSVSKINGETVPTAVLKEVGGFLIDIHGQHEHQSLLYKNKHLEILDYYAKSELKDWKEKCDILYKQYRDLRSEFEKSNTSEEERKREISFLEYEINEIEAAQLRLGEEEELDLRHKKLSNMEAIVEGVSNIYQITAESNRSISQELNRVVKIVNKLSELDSDMVGFQTQISDIDSLLSDFNRELHNYIVDLNYDGQEFGQVEERLNLIHRLKSKYGNSLEKINEYYKKAKDKLKTYQEFEQYQEELLCKLKKSEEKMENCCKAISKIRKKNAKELFDKIYQALLELNFLDVNFSIEFKQLEYFTGNGYDEIEFCISTNPGEDMKPLGKIASGGELSRIMLAIKSVLADNDQVGALIFDEIDVGVSGRTAQKVSEKLAEISRKRQVICITHLSQIAAMADTHYIIEKSSENLHTTTTIRRLEQMEEIMELARLLGGVKITDTVIDNAKEMKELASVTKNC
ncbi:DNA repair protein RecN [Anaeromicropila populeti]|uniref:DNA repair protein RecN n=1 Tax=Anaeromicropila populeti TaxID=37658 RepID=A0A1I6IKQ6_9FIRM|nr:DNA repair protein RecN [Anaeromicropila populeti]SFR67357.1 DNA replication and repair protein RecN [Anaeromicropila populeti]